MITELTPKQEAQLEVYAHKWRKIRYSVELANRIKAENGVRLAYISAGFSQPQDILWFDSPLAMALEYLDLLALTKKTNENIHFKIGYGQLELALTSCEKQVSQELWHRFDVNFSGLVGNNIYLMLATIRDSIRYMPNVFVQGQDDAHYLSKFDYYHNYLDLYEETKPLLGLWEIAQHAGWWIPFRNICLISERHTTFQLDINAQPHCEDGLAIGYPDGWGVYAWHGVHVPEYVIMRPQDITPDKIMSEPNTEVARVMLERYGQDNFIRDGGFTIQQSDDYGDLYRVEFDNGDEPIVAVHVNDASTDRKYFLYVPSHIRTAHEGVAWSFGYDNPSDYKPDRET